MTFRRRSDSRLERSIPAAVLLAIGTTGCVPLLFDGSCGPGSRLETTTSPLRDGAGNVLGSATFTLNESRGGEFPRNFQLVLMGPVSGPRGGLLRDHIAGVVITEPPGALRFDIPVLPASVYGEEIIGPAGVTLDVATYSALRRAVHEGRIRLHVETSAGAPAVQDISFPAVAPRDWDRAVCT